MPAPSVSPVTPPIRRRQNKVHPAATNTAAPAAAAPRQDRSAAATTAAIAVATISSVLPTKRLGVPTERGLSSCSGRAYPASPAENTDDHRPRTGASSNAGTARADASAAILSEIAKTRAEA